MSSSSPTPIRTILICTITLDGRLARGDGALASGPPDWGAKEDMRFFARETRRMGVVVMGHTTYQTIGKSLPARLNVVLTRSPQGKPGIAGALEFTDQPPGELLEALAARGYSEVAIAGGAQINRLFLQAGLLDELWVTVSPKIIGQGPGLFGDAPLDVDLDRLSHEMLSEQVLLLRYRVRK